jgi:hypothetical protein
MRSALCILAASLGMVAIVGCEQRKIQEPVALAKLPDLAYPVVLPPTDTLPPTATKPAPPITPDVKDIKVAKTRPRPRPKSPAANEKVPTSSSTMATGQPNVPINVPPADAGSAISAGIPHSDEMHHRQNTAELIQLTESNLRSIDRQLTGDEQNQVDQIKNFLAQARSATAENDLVRAHNLALKAHLLSDELVSH